MELPATQDAAYDANGNPGIEITGCPNCGRVPAAFRGVRYLSIIGHAALRNGGQQHPNDPCSRACRLQWEYAEHVHESGLTPHA